MKKITQCIRFEKVLKGKCTARATAQQLTLSEWVRQILRREVGLSRK